MQQSPHNIFSKIKNSEEYFLINLLIGQADILNSSEATDYLEGNFDKLNEITDKGYLAEKKTEDILYKEKYLEFIANREKDEIQLFFITNYTCNFSCSYCYQNEYIYSKSALTQTVIDSFFNYVNQTFVNRKKYITLFGGEPLIPSETHKQMIAYFLEKTKENNLDVAIVTNGYQLDEYLELLTNYSIREIQITLDGSEKIHNQRRKLKNGSPTFDKIVSGLDHALSLNIPVNLRVVLDRENINDLQSLAKFAIEKGWTKNSLFKTQLGRNYELHHCISNRNILYNRIDLYNEIHNLLNKFPFIKKFHAPAFSITKFLFEEGKLPKPLFDSCPGTKTEWAFDYVGNIYSCTATVGKTEEKLGTFYPEIKLDLNKIEKWQERDILSISQCKNCSIQLACGGGCAAVAKNKTGSINNPDCRPVKELIELGMDHYFNKK